MTEKVSVIITCYNYDRFLREAVDSVLAQTYPNIEIVVVNDGSTDDTHAIMQRYLPDSRFIYISQPNSGHAKAKNTGVLNATGTYIAFLDADDVWRKDKLTKQIPLFKNEKVGVVYSRAEYIDKDGNIVGIDCTNKYLRPQKGNVSKNLFFDNFILFSSSVVRKDLLEKVGRMDETIKMGNDWDLWLRSSVHCEFDFVDEKLMLYRVGHPGQMSKNLEERQRCSDQTMRKFALMNPDIVSRDLIREAFAYTYNLRGYYFRGRDIKRSTHLYVQSLQTKFFNFRALKGLAGNFWHSLKV